MRPINYYLTNNFSHLYVIIRLLLQLKITTQFSRFLCHFTCGTNEMNNREKEEKKRERKKERKREGGRKKREKEKEETKRRRETRRKRQRLWEYYSVSWQYTAVPKRWKIDDRSAIHWKNRIDARYELFYRGDLACPRLHIACKTSWGRPACTWDSLEHPPGSVDKFEMVLSENEWLYTKFGAIWLYVII